MEFKSSLKEAENFTCTELNGAVKLRLNVEDGLAAEPPLTIPQFFKEHCEKFKDNDALCFETIDNNNENLKWLPIKYSEYAAKVEQTALLLLHIGLEQRTSVGVLAHNCPEWFYINFGAIKANGIVFGMYATSSTDAVQYMLQFAEATVCIVDDAEQMAKVHAVRKNLPKLKAIVQLNGPFDDFFEFEDGYYKWQNLIDRVYGEDLKLELRQRECLTYANECAAIVFTSGTVGYPKAIMLSHDNLVFEAKAILQKSSFSVWDETRIVSYLPMSHIAGQLFDMYLGLHVGACIYIADRNALRGTLLKTLLKARPTVLLSVPRVYEKIKDQLMAREAQMGRWMRYLFVSSRDAVLEYYIKPEKRSFKKAFINSVAFFIMRRIKKALGLDCCRLLFCGAAPLNEDVRRYFLSLDMPLYETYGLSEAAGAITFNDNINKWQTCGQTINGSELKIHNTNKPNEEGEICQRGRMVFMGYLKNPKETAETIDDNGWLHSGDLGCLDEDGYLIATGRIKELVITAGGENIPPVLIEETIKQEMPFISNAMIVGDQRKFLIVLLTLKTEVDADTGQPLNSLRAETIAWLKSLNLEFKSLTEVLNTNSKEFVKPPILHEKIQADIEAGLQRANARALSNAQRVQKFALLPNDFSIPTGELGPTLKIRRKVIQQKYAELIDALYQ